jgi:hypothetical protein
MSYGNRRLDIARFVLATACLFFLLGFKETAPDDGVWLITPEEAAAPAEPPERPTRGIFDKGPLIELITPSETIAVSVPVQIWIQFKSIRAPVDLDTLRVTMGILASFNVTDRVRPYASADGIRIPNARMPSGTYRLRVRIGDTNGDITVKQFTVQVG